MKVLRSFSIEQATSVNQQRSISGMASMDLAQAEPEYAIQRNEFSSRSIARYKNDSTHI